MSLSMVLKMGGSLALVKDKEIDRMKSIEKRKAKIMMNSDPIGITPSLEPPRKRCLTLMLLMAQRKNVLQRSDRNSRASLW